MNQKIKNLLSTNLKKVIAIVLAIVVLICSMTVAAKQFTDPQTYSKTVNSIDEKKATVLGVSAAIAGSATLLAAVPDDSTTPLATEMMDLSSYLAAVVCVLVLEKSLLTVLGATSCYLLIPITCLLTIGFIIKRAKSLLIWAIKIGIFALALLLIIPISMQLSDYIYEINQVTLEPEIDEVIEFTETEEAVPWYTKIWNTITETVQNAADSAVEGGKRALNKFIDAVSVFVIAYCAIPILTVLVFLWLIKFLFGLNININYEALNPKNIKQRIKAKSINYKAELNSEDEEFQMLDD